MFAVLGHSSSGNVIAFLVQHFLQLIVRKRLALIFFVYVFFQYIFHLPATHILTRIGSNAFGEEVIVDNTDNAIAKACAQTGAIVNDYSAAPVYMTNAENGAHEWIIEFEKLPVPLETFVTALDKALQEINSDYEAKRHKNIALRMPVVHQMPVDGFKHWLKDKGKLGGQHKVPRLSNDRHFIEEMLSYTKK